MKARLLPTLLVLVVLPTAVLTLMAGRALHNWEAVLDRRLHDAALNTLHGISSRMNAGLDQDLGLVAEAVSECVARGASPALLEERSGRLRETHPLVAQIYLFMNPWGFLHPPAPASAAEESGGSSASSEDEPLLLALRRAIATGAATEKGLRFTLNDVSYAFAELPASRGLYAGFRINADAWTDRLLQALRSLPRGGVVVVAEGAGLSRSYDGRHDSGSVVLSDGFGEPAIVDDWNAGNEETLSQVRLRAPFDHVRLAAVLRNREELHQAGAVQARLLGWGIALLAAGIVGGAWIVLLQAAREIERAKTRSEFIMGLSHDLRTPISAMKVMAESLYLNTVTDPGKQKQFLGALVKESDRLNQMVERVLFLVRFGQGALDYGPRPLDPAALVSSAVEGFRDLIPAQGAGAVRGPLIRFQAARDLPPIMGDESALAQVMFNLLDNAARYGRRIDREPATCGRPASEIDVEVDAVTRPRRAWDRRRRWVRIAVRDYGEGLSAKERRRVFNRFYRAPGAREKNVSGAGLGLALCRHVARSHGGWIEVSSPPAEGCTFAVFLPVGSGPGGNASQGAAEGRER
jgi:signal transduction histidine kinase